MPTTTEPTNTATITLTITGCETHRRDPSTGLPLPSLSRILSLFELAQATVEHEASDHDLAAASLIVDWLTRFASSQTNASEKITAADLVTEIAEIIQQVARRQGQTSLEVMAEIIELSRL
jgi:hypothetical protein